MSNSCFLSPRDGVSEANTYTLSMYFTPSNLYPQTNTMSRYFTPLAACVALEAFSTLVSSTFCTLMCSGSEAGSHLRLIDFFTTQRNREEARGIRASKHEESVSNSCLLSPGDGVREADTYTLSRYIGLL